MHDAPARKRLLNDCAIFLAKRSYNGECGEKLGVALVHDYIKLVRVGAVHVRVSGRCAALVKILIDSV
jgi:hypothetical protein